MKIKPTPTSAHPTATTQLSDEVAKPAAQFGLGALERETNETHGEMRYEFANGDVVMKRVDGKPVLQYVDTDEWRVSHEIVALAQRYELGQFKDVSDAKDTHMRFNFAKGSVILRGQGIDGKTSDYAHYLLDQVQSGKLKIDLDAAAIDYRPADHD